MVTVDKIESGIAKFVDNEVMPAMPTTGLQKIAVGVVISLFIKRLGPIMEQLKTNPTVAMLGVFNPAGEVDIDLLYESVKEQFPKEGLRIEIPATNSTFTFKANDVDRLYSYIVN